MAKITEEFSAWIAEDILAGETDRLVDETDRDIVFNCGNCDARLPKEDWSINGPRAEIDCPACGECNHFQFY